MADATPNDELMKRFMRAYAKADRAGLSECLTEDFVWHTHEGPDAPIGRELLGVDAMVETIKWRQSHWRDVSYQDMSIVGHGDLIVQTFRVSGIDENGEAFDCRAVDLYPLRDGKLAKKDTYWKRIVSG
jgi:ketosteroid isomerase-like protein